MTPNTMIHQPSRFRARNETPTISAGNPMNTSTGRGTPPNVWRIQITSR